MTSPENQLASLPRLSIVLVNWNSAERLGHCLDSIERAERNRFHLSSVVVVDNASSDRSLEAIERSSLPLMVIRNATNRGFAMACNQGAAAADSDLVLFLNPDTRLETSSLDAPVAFLEKDANQRIGICGIQLRGDDGSISRTCAVYPTFGRLMAMTLGLSAVFPDRFQGLEMSTWDHRTSRCVDHVIGAFYLVRRSVFEALGGFDPRFFVYFEDLDFSLRAARAGWGAYYLTDTHAYHESGGSSKQIKATRLFYVSRSRAQLAWKHLSALHAAIITVAILVLEPDIRFLRAVLARDLSAIREVVAGTAQLWAALIRSPRAFLGFDRAPGSRRAM